MTKLAGEMSKQSHQKQNFACGRWSWMCVVTSPNLKEPGGESDITFWLQSPEITHHFLVTPHPFAYDIHCNDVCRTARLQAGVISQVLED